MGCRGTPERSLQDLGKGIAWFGSIHLTEEMGDSHLQQSQAFCTTSPIVALLTSLMEMGANFFVISGQL
jgi:hypothetical protein